MAEQLLKKNGKREMRKNRNNILALASEFMQKVEAALSRQRTEIGR